MVCGNCGYIQVNGGLRLAVCFLGLVHEEARESRSMNLVWLLISFSGFMSRACPEKHIQDLYDLVLWVLVEQMVLSLLALCISFQQVFE